MTAQPVEPAAHGLWAPDPLRQRLANYTIEDVLALPGDAPRVELRDGVIALVDGGYEVVADSTEELALAKPFELRLRVRDIAP